MQCIVFCLYYIQAILIDSHSQECLFRCRPICWKVDNRGQWRFNQELYSLLVSFLLLGVLSLVTVQPTAAPVAKQLLPKTLGPSNVNIAAHMQHVPHMVSNGPHNYHIVSSYIV